MHMHGGQTGMQLVTHGGVQLGLVDLAVHLLRQHVQHRAGVLVHVQLQVDEELEVLVFLLGVLLHQLGQGLAGDVLGDDGPLAVDLLHVDQLGNGQAGFLHAGGVQRLIEHVGLLVAFVKDLDGLIAIAVHDLLLRGRDDGIELHCVTSCY